MGEQRLGLVLVHGIRSSPAMWAPLKKLIAEDTALRLVRPLPFGYSTGLWRLNPTRTFPTFNVAADSLKEYLDTEGEAYTRLMVVAHSQGGLIVQRYLTRMLAEGRGRDLARIRRVVLLACPNDGSEMVLSLRRNVFGLRHPQERQLRPLNDEITSTRRALLRDVVNASEVTDRTCPIPFSVYAGESDRIVSSTSAQSVFPDAAALPGDHKTIARPDSRQHRTYTTLRRHILTAASPDPPGPVEPPPDALPSVPVDAYRTDALALGVHPVIESSAQGKELPPQPPYVTRSHDAVLRVAVEEASAGHSRLAVVVGGSSTGKTRCCFEALRLLDSGWRLWRPPSAKDLVEALSSVSLLPKTVLWLNETQRYLTALPDDVAARALQSLLDDPARGPVLVLGTLWPERLRDLAADENSAAAQLLEDRQIFITDTGFQGAARAVLEEAAARDLRLAEALAASPDEVTQYLAGSRELLMRYHSTPDVQALVNAAVDAARLGYAQDVSAGFLERAGGALLPESYRRTRDEAWRSHWFVGALSEAGKPCRGVPGPLTTLGSAPEKPTEGTQGYRLADYLRQKVGAQRVLDCPPDAWWEATVGSLPSPAGVLALARAAHARARYRVSTALARQALDMDPSLPGHTLLVETLAQAGHAEDAASVAESALDHGEAGPARRLAEQALEAGDTTSALEWLERATQQVGSDATWTDYSQTLLKAGRIDEALAAGERVPDWHVRHIGYDLADAGYPERVLPVARKLAARGHPSLMASEAHRLNAAGHRQEAVAVLEEAGAAGSSLAYEELTFLFEEAGDPRRAEAFGQRAANEHGYGKALKRLSSRRERNGDLRGSAQAMIALGDCPGWEWWYLVAAEEFTQVEEFDRALDAAEKAAAGGHPVGWVLAAVIAKARDDERGMEDALGRAELSEDAETWHALGDFRAEQRDYDKAAEAYRRAVELGDTTAWSALAAMWHDAGRTALRDAVVAEAIAAGHIRRLSQLPDHYADSGDDAAAEALVLRASELNQEGPGIYLARRWHENGRRDEALNLALALSRFGHTQALAEWVKEQWAEKRTEDIIKALTAQDAANALRRRPDNTAYLLASYAEQGSFDSFRHHLSAEHNPATLLHLGRLCEELDLAEAATAAFERAIELGEGRALVELARLRQHQGDSGADPLLLRAVDAGVPNALESLIGHYEATRRRHLAGQVRRYGVSDGAPAAPW
ncbi:hypothetical protein STRCI_007878 [Streptomyces cinnabarinus]|uniref:Tetratricopeptide repeat protein n=1 Tax=Streptomyces cinnabarinus TaxID=67287 RepID=A0ABY7KRV6_9ACTN|nr:hypothetical protein [Streptomyces cinnabarinus]WAZ26315.1 hypothetical protein STRCI_007878 [Streptomyces cinnabarinus]